MSRALALAFNRAFYLKIYYHYISFALFHVNLNLIFAHKYIFFRLLLLLLLAVPKNNRFLTKKSNAIGVTIANNHNICKVVRK